jgi:hypothetical protein
MYKGRLAGQPRRKKKRKVILTFLLICLYFLMDSRANSHIHIDNTTSTTTTICVHGECISFDCYYSLFILVSFILCWLCIRVCTRVYVLAVIRFNYCGALPLLLHLSSLSLFTSRLISLFLLGVCVCVQSLWYPFICVVRGFFSYPFQIIFLLVSSTIYTHISIYYYYYWSGIGHIAISLYQPPFAQIILVNIFLIFFLCYCRQPRNIVVSITRSFLSFICLFNLPSFNTNICYYFVSFFVVCLWW